MNTAYFSTNDIRQIMMENHDRTNESYEVEEGWGKNIFVLQITCNAATKPSVCCCPRNSVWLEKHTC